MKNGGVGMPLALWAAMTLAAFPAAGQIVSDPMRPPEGVETTAPEAGLEAGPVLQSVMIAPGLRAAIISGQLVRQGEKYGDSVLVKVAENEVVLRSGGETQVLKLYPGVDKREAAPAAKTAPRRGRAK
ncbi:MAG TPA: MSHA biogenesis protein MshK [Burkholderiales bacterium]|nr:MSHA biogenesis protein MshK [Burkholderiales bacterium]